MQDQTLTSQIKKLQKIIQHEQKLLRLRTSSLISNYKALERAFAASRTGMDDCTHPRIETLLENSRMLISKAFAEYKRKSAIAQNLDIEKDFLSSEDLVYYSLENDCGDGNSAPILN